MPRIFWAARTGRRWLTGCDSDGSCRAARADSPPSSGGSSHDPVAQERGASAGRYAALRGQDARGSVLLSPPAGRLRKQAKTQRRSSLAFERSLHSLASVRGTLCSDLRTGRYQSTSWWPICPALPLASTRLCQCTPLRASGAPARRLTRLTLTRAWLHFCTNA